MKPVRSGTKTLVVECAISSAPRTTHGAKHKTGVIRSEGICWRSITKKSRLTSATSLKRVNYHFKGLKPLLPPRQMTETDQTICSKQCILVVYHFSGLISASPGCRAVKQRCLNVGRRQKSEEE